MTPPCCLQHLLRSRAQSDTAGRLFFYSNGNSARSTEVTRHSLYARAKLLASCIQRLPGFQPGSPILLHVDNHWDTILWFWSILLADGLPVLSSPFSHVEEHRSRHVNSLSKLLQSPLGITRARLLPLFGKDHGMHLHTIESLLEGEDSTEICLPSSSLTKTWEDPCPPSRPSLAMLMLTSGSTGNAKAVQISHSQVLASVRGKSIACQLRPDRPFLNWIGLDHVGALVEIHLHALWHGVDEIHVATADMISSPTIFLDLLSSHKVSRTFAPNFFLAKLASVVVPETASARLNSPWDLSSLQFLVSGGEANDLKTCTAISDLLSRYGAPRNALAPGFGMTETCAGCIYNTNCPEYDAQNLLAVASLGTCVPGIRMRVALSGRSGTELAPMGQPGDLQVSGPIVFEGYYRNEKATTEAFTRDGWFITGDRASISPDGYLHLMGRTDDTININGIKIVTVDLQTSLEASLGRRVNRLVVFGSRGPSTEQVTIAYMPNEWPMPPEDVANISNIASQVCLLNASTRPIIFAVSSESQPLIPISALGKISRAKMRTLFEAGRFERDLYWHQQALDSLRQHRKDSGCAPLSELESFLIDDIASARGLCPEDFDVTTSLFELGFSSLDLIKLKHRIDSRMGVTIPLITILTNPSAQSLATVLTPDKDYDSSNIDHVDASTLEPVAYEPVITLRSSGSKTPLWLVHPGVGEVLVFVGLAKHMTDDDRPVYALRARGFEKNQPRFSNLEEIVDTYVSAIQRRQSRGPYAIAGYSYGTMLAFEISKRLNEELGPGSVRFLGSFNLPPHIKQRMRQLDWNACLLNLSYFVGLTTEEYASSVDTEEYRRLSKSQAVEQILRATDHERMRELGLKEHELLQWADLAYGLQSMAIDYEPSGSVDSIDVFHAEPLKAVAATREVWLSEHLSRWTDFSTSAPRFHAVGGAHYTMIDADHVASFSWMLRSALRERGL